MNLAIIPLLVGFSGLFLILYLYWTIKKESAGTPRMKEIASFIQEGANAFLKRQFKTILYFILALVAILLIAFWPRWQIAFSFLVGGLLSQLAIFIGMNAAVRANVRTTNAARLAAGKALTLAFRGGAIMGLTIVSFNLLGISLLYLFFGASPTNPEPVSLLVGFGFGVSLGAIFAQLGGGIYTKAADISADLVGKIEVGYRRMTRETLPLLLIRLEITLETVQEEVLIFSSQDLTILLPQ